MFISKNIGQMLVSLEMCNNITFHDLESSISMGFLKHSLLFPLLALVLSGVAQASQPEPPTVLVSIKPLQIIAAAITTRVSTPELLLEPGVSPHDYSMKPSDVKRLASSDLIFWVGEDLELFLRKPLQRYGRDKGVIALMDEPGIQVREFLSLEEPDEGHGTAEHDGHDHNHGSHDPHIWLDPNNALAIAKSMAVHLAESDAVRAHEYLMNYQNFERQVKAIDQQNRQQFKQLSDKGFFVFHDAWGYFTRHYGLTVSGIFTLSPEQKPGARHIAEIREKLKQSGKTCIFREPQFKPAYLDTVLKDLDVHVEVLDPLASDFRSEMTSYPLYLKGLASIISSCMAST